MAGLGYGCDMVGMLFHVCLTSVDERARANTVTTLDVETSVGQGGERVPRYNGRRVGRLDGWTAAECGTGATEACFISWNAYDVSRLQGRY